MARLTINGKAAATTAKPARPTIPKPAVHPEEWGDVNTDPFAVPAGADRRLLASELADLALWCDGYVEGMATLAVKAARLSAKLACPDLADDPHRPGAIAKARDMDTEIINAARDIVTIEAKADRSWQYLTPDERGSANADYWWGQDANQSRLIGQAFLHFGTRYAWPAGFRLDRLWFRGLPLCVLMDLRTFRVLAFDPNPRPPIFPDEANDTIPMDIRKQLEARGIT